MTAGALAEELEVAHRTVLRDMDALTEAGLPIIAYQGNQGGFELGFNYRTRLTGLASDEAEALAIVLNTPTEHLAALGIADAARRAIGKIRESLPDQVREKIVLTNERFRIAPPSADTVDPRIAALATAVRERRRVRLDARSASPREIFPLALINDATGWAVLDGRTSAPVSIGDWRDINISGDTF